MPVQVRPSAPAYSRNSGAAKRLLLPKLVHRIVTRITYVVPTCRLVGSRISRARRIQAWTRLSLASRRQANFHQQNINHSTLLCVARACVQSSWSSKRSRALGKHFGSKHFNKKRRRNDQTAQIIEFQGSKFEPEPILPPIKPLNPTQANYLDALRTSPQVIVLGPAGTGKTWIAATYAADLYRKRRIGKIILTRPNVPCGRSLGFFPGSLEEKFAPWAAPIVEAIKERIGQAAYEIALKKGDIEMVPFEVMRGRSWK